MAARCRAALRQPHLQAHLRTRRSLQVCTVSAFLSLAQMRTGIIGRLHQDFSSQGLFVLECTACEPA